MKMINNYLVSLFKLFFAGLLTLPWIAHGLVPIEGVIFGDVRDIKQYDPLSGVLTRQFSQESKQTHRSSLSHYRGLYLEGLSLNLKCEKDLRSNYSNSWKESTAKRSIVSTLQYIGLDLAIKGIVSYAKKTEMTDASFKTMASNLVTNTCNQNLSVYSLKRLKNNFLHYWETDSKFSLPSIKGNPFFGQKMKQRHDTLEVAKREFNYTIRNFRSLCSWDGDTENYAMLSPYLNNSFIMSYIYNHLQKRKIEYIEKTGELVYGKDSEGIQVACDNLICRKRKRSEFIKLFPRSIGSTELSDDLEGLYCNHFKRVQYKKNGLNQEIKSWLKRQTQEEGSFEAMNFLSLLTGIPEFLIVANRYDEVIGFFRNNLKEKWDKWADQKSNELESDLLYEESLEVKLAQNKEREQILKGEFRVTFDLTLGELDRLIDDVDKIDSTFYLSFPSSYLRHLKKQSIYLSNKGKHDELKKLNAEFVKRINYKLEKKKSSFKVSLWNKRMGEIIAGELLRQIDIYEGKKFKDIKSYSVKVPVKFRYGLFALQYIKKKFEYSKKVFTDNSKDVKNPKTLTLR